MNPRLFCREYQFPRALSLTYTFNPLFFERIILKDLIYGGSTDITVVGDRRELQEAITRYAEQINYLGKSYLAAPADTYGAFHPKLLLRIGTNGARLLTGSGNLTFGGWGGNREMAFQLNLDTNQPGSAGTVHYILDHISPYLTSEVGQNALDRLRDYPWLAAPDESPSAILITTPNEPLSAQLQKRWAGRRFRSMMVMTGSTDEHGAFIRWCHQQFGIVECVVAVSPENASFLKNEIERCPAKVSLAPFSGSQMLHAKFYWFDGPDGPAAIVGSANCSSAAWLLAPAHGGNVETVKVYDAADANEFSTILSAFPETRVAVERIRPADEVADDKTSPSYFIKAIHLYRDQRFLEVTLNQSIPEAAAAYLIGPDRLEVQLVPGDSGLLSAQVGESLEWPETTCLARVRIVAGKNSIETPMHWVDDMDSIVRASQIKPPAEPFKNLPRSRTSSEHEKVLLDLATISASIFSESAAYRDPPRRRSESRSVDLGQTVVPVKPEDLVKSLHELGTKKDERKDEGGRGVYLSMTGVLRALFEEVESLAPTENEAAIGSTDDPETDPTPGEKPSLESPPPQGDRELPTPRHRQKLKEDLEVFFEKFSSETFSRECTASKLVQASAYPLAIALLGQRGGWLLPEESGAIVTRVVDILLNRSRVGRTEHGLLEEIRNRYRGNGQEDVFLQVLGDGTLWVVLLAVLAQLSPEAGYERFQWAINLHRVYGCETMRSDTSLGRLTALVTRLDVERARTLLSEDAPKVSTAIAAIEKMLGENRDKYLGDHSSWDHQVGDYIWHPDAGWGVIRGISSATTMDSYLHLRGKVAKVAKKNFYLNLRIAAQNSPVLRNYLDEIQNTGLIEISEDPFNKSTATGAA